jgi:pimeloyl-ACP methyl ester carboxylesterase
VTAGPGILSAMKIQQITLPDGRSLDVMTGGGAGPMAVIAHHGTPGEGTKFSDWEDAVSARGLRLVGYSRPGYATSDRDAGRRVSDVAADVAALADALGIERFVTVGRSGGGPHSIACAALLPDRCLAAAALVTVAPWQADGLDFFAGMAQGNVEEFNAALAGEDALRAWMATHGEPYRHITGETIASTMASLLPPVDLAVLTGALAEEDAAGTRRALEHGFDGWIDDDLAFARPWGFDVRSIRVPVRIWQGELDQLVSVAHGQWLADRIPGATFNLAKGHGHLSLALEHRDAILDDLLASAGLA